MNDSAANLAESREALIVARELACAVADWLIDQGAPRDVIATACRVVSMLGEALDGA